MKLKKIVDAYEGLKEVGENIFDVRTGFHISVVMNELEPLYNGFMTARGKYITEHGVTESDGFTTLKNEHKKAFFEEMDKLLDEDVKFKFSGEKVKLNENINMKPNTLRKIVDFIEIE